MAIEHGDIYWFTYNDEYRKKLFDPNHCFDGQLVAIESGDGIILIDTYWAIGLWDIDNASFSDGQRFTEEEARKKGKLTYKCNIKNVDIVNHKNATDYYRKSEWFNLSRQHGCYQAYGILKTAKRDKQTMLDMLSAQVRDQEYKLMSAAHELNRIAVKIHQVQNGDLNVYL